MGGSEPPVRSDAAYRRIILELVCNLAVSVLFCVYKMLKLLGDWWGVALRSHCGRQSPRPFDIAPARHPFVPKYGLQAD